VITTCRQRATAGRWRRQALRSGLIRPQVPESFIPVEAPKLEAPLWRGLEVVVGDGSLRMGIDFSSTRFAELIRAVLPGMIPSGARALVATKPVNFRKKVPTALWHGCVMHDL
jgi:hypothetical protein